MQRPMLPQLRETSDFHAPPADFNPMQRRIALDYKARADWTMQPTTKYFKIRMQYMRRRITHLHWLWLTVSEALGVGF